jgi:hypothetical protein
MVEAWPMEALLTYLRETRTTPKAFAKLIGLDADPFARLLSGEERIEPAIAQRIVDATGGAIFLDDLTADGEPAPVIVDMRSRFAAASPDIDAARLAGILAELLPEMLGGSRRRGDSKLPGLAAEAAANTYSALSTVTTRSGADRLVQALRPVFAEILEEMSAPLPARRRLDLVTRRAAVLYFQARPEKRRA